MKSEVTIGVVVIIGVPSIRKTTVIKEAAEAIDTQFVTFEKVMADIANEMYLVKDIDKMRKLTLE